MVVHPEDARSWGRLSLRGVSGSDSYSKAFMHLITQDGKDTRLELDTDSVILLRLLRVPSCSEMDRNFVNSGNSENLHYVRISVLVVFYCEYSFFLSMSMPRKTL